MQMQDGVTMHAQKVLGGGALAQYWAGTPEFTLHRGDDCPQQLCIYSLALHMDAPSSTNTCKHPDPYHAQSWTPPCPAALARRPTRRPWTGLLKPLPASLPCPCSYISLPGQC